MRAATKVRMIAVAGSAALSLSFTACGTGQDQTASEAAPTSDLATEYTGPFLQIQSEKPFTLGSDLTAEDGTEAVLSLTFEGGQPPTVSEGEVDCGDETIDAARVEEVEGGTGSVEVNGVGTIDLAIETNVAAFSQEDAPPACSEHIGTWTGTAELDGSNGDFTVVSTDHGAEGGDPTTTLTLADE